jgi:hypothetical protein
MNNWYIHKSKKPINPKIYRLLKPFVFKLVGDEGLAPLILLGEPTQKAKAAVSAFLFLFPFRL